MISKDEHRKQVARVREMLAGNRYFPAIGQINDMKDYTPSDLIPELEILLKQAYSLGTEKEWERAQQFYSQGKNAEALRTLDRVEKYAVHAGVSLPKGFSEFRSDLENAVTKT